MSVNDVTIRKYIKVHENKDIIHDKLSKKEYNKFFKSILMWLLYMS